MIFSTFSIQYATKRCFRCGVRVEFSQKKIKKRNIYKKFTTILLEVEFSFVSLVFLPVTWNRKINTINDLYT